MAQNYEIYNAEKSVVKLSETLSPKRKIDDKHLGSIFVSCNSGLTKLIQ